MAQKLGRDLMGLPFAKHQFFARFFKIGIILTWRILMVFFGAVRRHPVINESMVGVGG